MKVGSIVYLGNPGPDDCWIRDEFKDAKSFHPNFGPLDGPRIAPKFVDGATVDLETAARIRAQIADAAMRDLIGKYKRFVPVVTAFAAMSKLPGTKVGCVVLGDAFQVLATGWNGAPRNSTADHDERSAERETRLDWTVHAEANAIANAARSGTSVEGGTLICTLMPCMTCAKLVVQAGVKRVLCPEPGADTERWAAEFTLTRALFKECRLDLIHYDILEGKEA